MFAACRIGLRLLYIAFMSSQQDPSRLRKEDLLGAWECFQGSGSQPWSRGVIVFKPYGRDIGVEQWLPALHASDFPMMLESLRGGCNEAPFGLRLSVRNKTSERTVDIVGVGDDTISVFFPGTGTGAMLFRKTRHPLS